MATAASSIVSAAILGRAVHRKMADWRRRELQLWETEQQPVLVETPTVLPTNSTLSKEIELPPLPPPPSPIALLSRPDRKSAVELIALAGPIFYVILAKVACYGAMTVRCTAFGVPALAAHSVMMRIFFFFSTFGDALSQTAQSFLPSTLYPPPGDRNGFHKILRRLAVVAVGLAVINSNTAAQALQHLGRYLTRDAVIVELMRQHTGFLAASIFLHPFIMLLEGTVIASRNFRSLVVIYTGTLGWQLAALRFTTGSFPAIWRTFFLFQAIRLGLYAYRVWWGQRKEKVKMIGS